MQDKTYKLLSEILIIRVSNTYAEVTSQSSQQKNMDQTNTHNTNQQSTEQQRSYPQKNDQATILVPYTQERDDTTIEDQIFYSKVPIKPTGHSKGYPKNN